MKISAWPKEKNARFNPFQSLLYRAIEQSKRAGVDEFHPKQLLGADTPDILHIHWPDAFLAAGEGWKFWPRFFLLRCLFVLAKIRNVPVIWTAHNFRRDGQRNAKRMERFFWPWFLSRVDGVIYMTKASMQNAISSVPSLAHKPHAVVPHGDYCAVINTLKSAAKRQDVPSILFFGSITKYKNAHRVLKAFLGLKPGQAKLAIKGKMSATEPDILLNEMLGSISDDRADDIDYGNKFLTEAELVDEIQKCDLVVFPYSDVLNSGAAIFALSVGRPILASNNALFSELQQQVGEAWVKLIDGELDADQLINALTHARALKDAGEAPDLGAFDWQAIAEKTVDFYQIVRSARGRALR